jgi:hypothetical protein
MQHGLSLCGLAMLAFGGAASAAVTVSQTDYNGWTGAYRLTNGTVELIFVPQIGRIMRYGYLGGPNILWNNPDMAGKAADADDAAKNWPNFGGDKLWPAPQDRWGWPPDPTLDHAPPTVKVLPNHHLLLTGQPSRKVGVQFTREIALAETGSEVTLKNTMRNVSDQKQIWGVWEIFQANDPTLVRLSRNRNGHFATGYYNFNKELPSTADMAMDAVLLNRDPKASYKLGSDAERNDLQATVQGQIFDISAQYEPGQPYPDHGCSQEVYSNPDPLNYMELEMLAPVHTLAAGRSTTFVTHWSLKKP